MLKKSVLIAGRHATSISLEDEFYAELQNIATAESTTVNKLITAIDKSRKKANLSSAIRVYILNYYKQKSVTPK
jgi:predicted DNA-binding ribbon-helix-helix protein